MKLYTVDIDDRIHHDWTEDKEQNPYIVETAGFQPLEVQIQRFEQAGLRAKYRADMFDSQDYRDMYLAPESRITADDDLEEIEEKLNIQRMIRERIISEKTASMQREANDQKSVASAEASETKQTGSSPAVGAENQ